METISLKNHNTETINNIKEAVGRMFADYFGNTEIINSIDDQMKEVFYIGLRAITGKCYLVTTTVKMDLVIEPLGESLHYIEINSFIKDKCDPKLKLELERILFEHT